MSLSHSLMSLNSFFTHPRNRVSHLCDLGTPETSVPLRLLSDHVQLSAIPLPPASSGRYVEAELYSPLPAATAAGGTHGQTLGDDDDDDDDDDDEDEEEGCGSSGRGGGSSSGGGDGGSSGRGDGGSSGLGGGGSDSRPDHLGHPRHGSGAGPDEEEYEEDDHHYDRALVEGLDDELQEEGGEEEEEEEEEVVWPRSIERPPAPSLIPLGPPHASARVDLNVSLQPRR